MVAIYGIGAQGPTPQGVVIQPDFRVGTVYNIWDGGATFVYAGDVVTFKEGEQYCRIVTADRLTYTLIEFSKLAVENPVIPPP